MEKATVEIEIVCFEDDTWGVRARQVFGSDVKVTVLADNLSSQGEAERMANRMSVDLDGMLTGWKRSRI